MEKANMNAENSRKAVLCENISELCARLECGEELCDIEVVEEDGEFYLVSGFESAMAYSMSFATYIPVTLIRGDKLACDYVQMKNSL